jgi:cellulose synthase/poly-beta-1,6-N-acetylglucosamine synthase-like glycosyltransferase
MLMHTLYILQILLIIFLGLPMIYLCVLSFSALIYKSHYHSPSAKIYRKYALVIPAHNEEKVIPLLLKDLKNLDYPSEKYDVFVIADNCTDKTADIVKKFGYSVLQRNDPDKKGKGFALHWGLNQILSKPHSFDGIIILDADIRFYQNSIHVLNSHIDKGAEVVQGYIKLKPEPGEWSSESTRFGRTLNNYVRALGRKKLGFPTTLKGIGMCFSVNVLKNNPWKAHSLTEDLEYGLQLFLKKINIIFAPEVIGYAISPHNPQNAESQRERWELGRFPLIRKYIPILIMAFLRNRSFRYLDALIDLITPPLVNYMFYIGILMAIYITAWSLGLQMAAYIVIAWFSLIILGFIHVYIGLIVADDRSLYRVFNYLPRYALWKAKIYIKVLLKGREDKWVRTIRD